MEAIWEPLRICLSVILAANNLTKESAPHIVTLLKDNLKISGLQLHLNPLAGGFKIISEASKTALNLGLLTG